MASFPSSWIVKKALQAPLSPTATPTRPATPGEAAAAAPTKPHATLFTRAPPSPTPTSTRHLSPTSTSHLSPAPLANPRPTSHRADASFSSLGHYYSPPSSPRSRRGSIVFSCGDDSHFLPNPLLDEAVLPNGPCGRRGCCGDELHPSSFLDPDYLDHHGIEGEGGEALGLGQVKPLPRQSPFTGHGQDAPAVFPSSWIVRSTPTPTPKTTPMPMPTSTPVLERNHAIPHSWEKAWGRPPPPVSMSSAITPSNPSPLRSAESIVVPPPAKAAVRRHSRMGSGSASQIATASDSSHITHKYLWDLKERPTQRELIDCWLQSTPGMEPRKRVKASHWFNNGSDASGDADEPHSRQPIFDAYSDYSTSTRHTTRPAA